MRKVWTSSPITTIPHFTRDNTGCEAPLLVPLSREVSPKRLERTCWTGMASPVRCVARALVSLPPTTHPRRSACKSVISSTNPWAGVMSLRICAPSVRYATKEPRTSRCHVLSPRNCLRRSGEPRFVISSKYSTGSFASSPNSPGVCSMALVTSPGVRRSRFRTSDRDPVIASRGEACNRRLADSARIRCE